MARFLTVCMVGTLWLTSLAAPGAARGLIRDAGVEYALEELAAPLMTAAGLPGGRTPVLVVNDMTPNAFVIDGRAIFVHAGLILRLRTAEELQAVIAHEIAHITNGHITRRQLNAQNARLTSLMGLALGAAAGALTGEGTAALGVAAGSAGSARNVFFAHTREEEAAADRSGMRFLARAGVDPMAMARVMELFAGQEDLIPSRQDAYLRTHPLSRDRLRAIRAYAEVLGPQTSDAAVARYWHARAQAKLSAYLREPDHTFNRYPASDDSDAGRIARALAYMKLGQTSRAYAELDAILARVPEDPFVHELKGWIALESNDADRAVTAYAEAARLAPREAQVLAGYGRALLTQDTPAANAEALDVLRRARARDRFGSGMLRNLALAYARDGQPGMAALHTAERYTMLGDPAAAEVHARRAEAQLPTGSPGWMQAQDIITAAERAQNRR